MFAYKTNSPQYLDYIASVKSRKEIEADPDLCLLLENPYIKDNMEMAIRWAKAKTGDYQDKYDFLEYFMCNGPELDADTILHYRAKSFNDPVVMEIAYSYFSSSESQREIREKRKNKYGKNLDDCFQNPCFYLGRFTPMMGELGDEGNTYGLFSYMARNLKVWGEKKKLIAQVEEKRRQGHLTPEAAQTQIAEIEKKFSNSSDDTSMVKPSEAPQGTAVERKSWWKRLVIPAFERGWNLLSKDAIEGSDDFINELINNTNCVTNANQIGDWMSSAIKEKISIITKANVKRSLGDCSRLWSQLRNFNMFQSKNNTFGPISYTQLTGNTTPIGTNLQTVPNPAPDVSDATDTLQATYEVITNADGEQQVVLTGDFPKEQ